MFVMSTRNIIIPSPDGKQSVRLSRGQMGPIPAWAVKTAYFKALVADGKLVVSNSSKDKDEEKARRAAEKARKAAEEAVKQDTEETDQQESSEVDVSQDGE